MIQPYSGILCNYLKACGRRGLNDIEICSQYVTTNLKQLSTVWQLSTYCPKRKYVYINI